ANTYTGGTTISAGTLQLGNGGTTGSVTTSIVDNARLVFNRSDNVTYGGVISGSGSVIKGGGGVLTLTANNTYTGPTVIEGGVLAINSPNNLGTLGNPITLNGGTLRIFQNSFFVGRAITIESAGGTVDIAGNVVTDYRGTASGSG